MKRAYRAGAVISLDALEYNVKGIRSIIGEKTKLMGVIKTNAYGHGAVSIAKALDRFGADSFAVATVEEGIELRRHGITKPVLLLGYVSKEQYPELIINNIMPAVFTYEMARDLEAAARKLDAVLDIHLKIDTGMSRIGFKVNLSSVESIVMINTLCRHLRIQGIFTHMACADCEPDEVTENQVKLFRWMLDELEKRGLQIPLRHCANSASIMRYPEMKMNMVRAGIILYGLYPSEEVDKSLLDLKPVMSLTSHVTFVKTVPSGTGVSYGSTFVCKRPTVIATVSIGYGDGFPRAASNKGRVLIRNQSFPIIGRVCMDQLMVDVTDSVEEIKQGDKVVLVGSMGCEEISVEEASSYGDSFNYEFVCNINRRVPRIYMYDGKLSHIVDYLG